MMELPNGEMVSLQPGNNSFDMMQFNYAQKGKIKGFLKELLIFVQPGKTLEDSCCLQGIICLKEGMTAY